MSISKIVDKIKKEARQNIYQRQQEQEILQKIAAITSLEFAEQASEELDSKKHTYSFKAYLGLLNELRQLLMAGIPSCYALKAVQTGITVDRLIEAWKLFTEGEGAVDKKGIRDVSNIQKKSREIK